MYIAFDKQTKRVIDIGEKPFVNYSNNLDIAEYNGIIPKNDYLTVINERQETKTFVEKKIVLKTVIEKEPQTKRKLIYEEVDIKDIDGNVVFDKDGKKVVSIVPKWVEETIEVEVEKEVEEEVEETKTRTYLTCDLLANFYPSKTAEEIAKEKEEKYKKLVEILIRKKYSQGKVESIHSNYLKAMFNGTDLTSAKKEEYIAEFNAFQKYREECKKEAHIDVYGGEKQ